MDLGSTAFLCSFCEFKDHGLPDPSQCSSCFCWAHSITSNGSNGTPAMSTAWSSLPCRVGAQLWPLPALILLHTKKTEDLCGIWGRDSCNVGMDPPMARACVSCSDQWKVRHQNKNLCPIHWGMWLIIFLALGRFGQDGIQEAVSLWCDATPEGETIVGQRACPSPSHLSHMPQPVHGGRETSGSGCSTRATEQTPVIQPQPLLSPTAPLMKGPLFAHPPNPWMVLGDFNALVPKYLAAGMPSLACVPRKGHPDLPVHQRQLQKKRHYILSLTVWLQLILTLLVCLITCHSPCSIVKTRKQAECSK